jgi:DNA-binding LacI/PurR family transcriptional regulator
MRELGLPVKAESLLEGDHTVTGGKIALRKFLILRHQPTALVCSNDMTAIGVTREAHDRGVEIPKQLSIIGFDDIRTANFMNPPLTTIQMSQSELASIAFRALLENTNSETPSTEAQEYFLGTRLIIRDSTAFPRATRHVKLRA